MIYSSLPAGLRKYLPISALVLLLASCLVVLFWTGDKQDPQESTIEILHPGNNSILPPDMAAPAFRWSDPKAGSWTISIEDENGRVLASAVVSGSEWIPTPEQWAGVASSDPGTKLTVTISPSTGASATMTMSISRDAVGASLFYREVNLPFIDAVKDPSSIQWRYGSISERKRPPVVLTDLPVCGNCHSFSASGKLLGMDVDYANDKGSYVIKEISREVVLDKDSVITWSDYRRGEELTFGLLSQVSPDGRYVISTVEDRSVFVPMDDLDFSQLFFPVKGILVVYDREADTFEPLPGADDPEYVQSNPTWSPDGKHVVFARSKAHHLEKIGDKVLLSKEDCKEFVEGGKKFLFDLYRVPFNEGKGGTPEPLPGASHNGLSNFFPKYSPDGKWIVFCRAKSFMLLQPDSELYIIPAEGGEARRLQANTSRMNSWHTWSPNSRWLVFSSKQDGPYTKLYLTHMDPEGNSSPAILLDYLTSTDMAANIPEFVNAPPDAIGKMTESFIDEVSYWRAGNEFMKNNDLAGAERSFKQALSLNPEHVDTLNNYGYLLLQTSRLDEARSLLEKAVALNPDSAEANNNLSYLLITMKEFNEAIAASQKYLALHPDDPVALNTLGFALDNLGKTDEAITYYLESVRLKDDYTEAHCNLSNILTRTGKLDQATEHGKKCEGK